MGIDFIYLIDFQFIAIFSMPDSGSILHHTGYGYWDFLLGLFPEIGHFIACLPSL
jgi:hypothetical protein